MRPLRDRLHLFRANAGSFAEGPGIVTPEHRTWEDVVTTLRASRPRSNPGA